MHFLQNAFALALVLHGGLPAAQSKEIKGKSARGVFILEEEDDTNLSYYGTSVRISSNVPVTIQRYYDDMYVEGEQPVSSNEAKVLVTSNCAGTTYVPQVTFGKDSIEVNVQGALGGADMPYFKSSKYHATWDVTSYWCEEQKRRPPQASAPGSSVLSSIASAFKEFLRTNDAAEEEADAVPEAEARNLLSSEAVCNVNVEVMLDGCAHGMDVTAPKIRVMDASIKNASSQQNSENECVYDHTADIEFTTPRAGTNKGSLKVPSLDDQLFDGCMRAVPGRPFVDSTGKTLQASPLIAPVTIVGDVKVCAGGGDDTACLLDVPASANNGTVRHDQAISQNQRVLGQEWTKNAIGEDASVASFAAFSIALMTNGAPSDLVKDALEAALDEVRHARTSFAIASRLTGTEVRPGPLPASTHEFGHNLTALALAVAQEGCVDETLSALEAAAEAGRIGTVLAGGAEGARYAGVEEGVLAWIRDELRTIALEEGRHAALAWRTVEWVCTVDADACRLVKRHVLNEDALMRAFQRRFGSSFGSESQEFKASEDSWRLMIKADGQRNSVDSLVTLVSEEVLNGISRNLA